MLCLGLCLAALGSQGLDYALRSMRPSKALAPASARALPSLPGPEDQPPEPQRDKLDINQASGDILQRVPGIGAVLAEAIVAYRDDIGGFLYLEELMDVPGIGEKRFDALREWFFCPEP